MQMEGMVGAGLVLDFEFEEISDPGKATGRNMGNRLVAVLLGGESTDDTIDRRPLPDALDESDGLVG